MRLSWRLVLSAAATITLTAGAGVAKAGPIAEASLTQSAPGAQLWLSSYSGDGTSASGNSAAVSPDGTTLFVTGYSATAGSFVHYATVAYDTATGAQLWASIYKGPGNYDIAHQVAVSPDGSTVFVTGASKFAGTGLDYATVAYNAATGAELWASRYDGPGDGRDLAYSLAVSPDGRTVYVTGTSHGLTRGTDYATIAYYAVTGAQRWARRYNAPANRDDIAKAVTVSPDGRTVFVTGSSTGTTSGQDYATIAYAAADGARRWVSRFNGHANGADAASAVTVSPDGQSVFVTGTSAGATSGQDYATVAYAAATGARRWVSRYNGPKNSNDSASSIAAGPGGGAVYVTGGSGGRTTNYATVAYNAATGARRWVSTWTNPGCASIAAAVASGPGGGTVYVTGHGCFHSDLTGTYVPDYTTVAYDARTGALRWSDIYKGPTNGAVASALAIDPAGDRVYVTGQSNGIIVTIAYQG